jgi:hypothetical protein
MERSGKDFKRNLALFITAAVVTFGFITLLQVLPMPWFIVALVVMHGGIALFIVSKRRFRKTGFEVSRFYTAQYLMLLPYVLIMLYAFATRAGIVPALTEVKVVVTLAYTVLCAIFTTVNCLRMKKELERQYIIIAENDAKAGRLVVSS